MSVTLLHKYSSTAGQVPTAAKLGVREIGVNTADGVLYVQKTDGTIKAINPGLGLPPQSVTLDMGSIPLNAASFMVTVTGATLGQIVHTSISGASAIGAYPDEYEMEAMAAYGAVTAQNTIFFTLTCCDPLIVTAGKKIITFYVG